jgi:outer membrane protein assembly factor BamB
LVDRGAACIVDYANNTLFCGTDLPDGGLPEQKSLFALDTATGQLKWSDRAGPIINRPLLHGGRLYVASKPGSLMAYDAQGDGHGNGQRLWPVPVSVVIPGAIVSLNPVSAEPGQHASADR